MTYNVFGGTLNLTLLYYRNYSLCDSKLPLTVLQFEYIMLQILGILVVYI